VLLTPGNFYETGGYRDRGEKQKYYTGEIPSGYVLNQGELLVAMTEQAAGLLGSPILVPESGKFLHNQRLGLVTNKLGVAWSNEFLPCVQYPACSMCYSR
jgi:type I restriction enzyme S subunit